MDSVEAIRENAVTMREVNELHRDQKSWRSRRNANMARSLIVAGGECIEGGWCADGDGEGKGGWMEEVKRVAEAERYWRIAKEVRSGPLRGLEGGLRQVKEQLALLAVAFGAGTVEEQAKVKRVLNTTVTVAVFSTGQARPAWATTWARAEPARDFGSRPRSHKLEPGLEPGGRCNREIPKGQVDEEERKKKELKKIEGKKKEEEAEKNRKEEAQKKAEKKAEMMAAQAKLVRRRQKMAWDACEEEWSELSRKERSPLSDEGLIELGEKMKKAKEMMGKIDKEFKEPLKPRVGKSRQVVNGKILKTVEVVMGYMWEIDGKGKSELEAAVAKINKRLGETGLTLGQTAWSVTAKAGSESITMRVLGP
ncbi:hypothetical protein L211DRAFT_851812 [Terfezia boudieri ATCC MYA-4762]|uniref:Uncharacterized protein n=1 Tax=Terfezia boudieri ATCC MYA-4762 TaxID=1051890 RepID=A0A3N4LDV8_9PEZI|nr:hypothetical protein L211DRAFT_851812 [Terfezia boudieri ATCC MYA-4762]